MKKLLALASILFVASCQHTVFAEPEVVYKNKNVIEVKYLSAGIKSNHNENVAMNLIKEHCVKGFEIESRNTSGKNNFIKAKCD